MTEWSEWRHSLEETVYEKQLNALCEMRVKSDEHWEPR